MDEHSNPPDSALHRFLVKTIEHERHIQLGVHYFVTGCPFLEIADATQQLGWRCGKAYHLGHSAKSQTEMPYPETTGNYEEAKINSYFIKGFQSK